MRGVGIRFSRNKAIRTQNNISPPHLLPSSTHTNCTVAARSDTGWWSPSTCMQACNLTHPHLTRQHACNLTHHPGSASLSLERPNTVWGLNFSNSSQICRKTEKAQFQRLPPPLASARCANTDPSDVFGQSFTRPPISSSRRLSVISSFLIILSSHHSPCQAHAAPGYPHQGTAPSERPPRAA